MPMPTRARRGSQLWGASSSSSDEERERSEYGDDLSELSELSDSEFTPDTEDEAPGESEGDCLEGREYMLREHVLVKPRGSREWYRGVVVKIREPSSRDKRQLRPLYIVVFRRYRTNIRDAFSVLEGNIKPDTPALRAILLNS